MPVELKHLYGPKEQIKNGSVVKLDEDFLTGAGKVYPAGSRGVKEGSRRGIVLVRMEEDNALLHVPTHRVPISLAR